MRTSRRFKALKLRIVELRRTFLPRRFSKTGAYSSVQLDHARAYRVLVHAEIESYFEERVQSLADKAFQMWISTGLSSRCLTACLANLVGQQTGLPNKVGTTTTITKIIGKTMGQFRHTVINNHGIKSENLLSLLLPVGVDEVDIDSAWLSTIDGFGAKRGAVAHGAAISYSIDPKDDFSTVGQVIIGIKDIDLMLSELEASLK